MERRAQMVINTCVALGPESPIAFIHDVGAGGLSNALPELVKDAGFGGKFELRQVESADNSMSPLQIWCNEAQERYVLLELPLPRMRVVFQSLFSLIVSLLFSLPSIPLTFPWMFSFLLDDESLRTFNVLRRTFVPLTLSKVSPSTVAALTLAIWSLKLQSWFSTFPLLAQRTSSSLLVTVLLAVCLFETSLLVLGRLQLQMSRSPLPASVLMTRSDVVRPWPWARSLTSLSSRLPHLPVWLSLRV
ncbi:hypothetical protein LB505_010869 [Fusarium chuoi]|nr:hypothetical protein LB505_010869 [Fusarium chuoi]